MDALYDAYRRHAEAGCVPTWEMFDEWDILEQNLWLQARQDVENAKLGQAARAIQSQTVAEELVLPVLDEAGQDKVIRARFIRGLEAQRATGG